MKVKLLISRAGDGFVQCVGDVVEVNKGEAARLCESGQAEPVKIDKAERAIARRSKETRKE